MIYRGKQTMRWAEICKLQLCQEVDAAHSDYSFRAAYEPDAENTVTIEEAGLEEGEAPKFGLVGGSVPAMIEWLNDGEDSRYETN